MTDKEDYYWKEMEPIEDDDEFFADLCALIDKHSNSPDGRLRYLCGLEDFRNGWMDNWGVTQTLWGDLIDENPLPDILFACRECGHDFEDAGNILWTERVSKNKDGEDEEYYEGGCPNCGTIGRLGLIKG